MNFNSQIANIFLLSFAIIFTIHIIPSYADETPRLCIISRKALKIIKKQNKNNSLRTICNTTIKKNSPANTNIPEIKDDSIAKISETIKEAINHFYRSKFNKAKKQLLMSLNEIIRIEKQHGTIPSFPLKIKMDCYVYLMLTMKTLNLRKEAIEITKHFLSHIPLNLSRMYNIAPDGKTFIEEIIQTTTEEKTINPIELQVSIEQCSDNCTILFDNFEIEKCNTSLTLIGGNHSVTAYCGKDSGWQWQIRLDQIKQKEIKLSLNPEYESKCEFINPETIVCETIDKIKNPMEIGGNLINLSTTENYVILTTCNNQMIEKTECILKSNPLTTRVDAVEWEVIEIPIINGKKSLQWSYKSRKNRRKKKLFLIPILFGSTGTALMGSGIGLFIYSTRIEEQIYTTQDPWARAKKQDKLDRLRFSYKTTISAGVALALTAVLSGFILLIKKKSADEKQNRGQVSYK